jgi:hypothetical protein
MVQELTAFDRETALIDATSRATRAVLSRATLPSWGAAVLRPYMKRRHWAVQTEELAWVRLAVSRISNGLCLVPFRIKL